MQEPVVAIVVAAGSGVRFGGDVPKALVQLGGRPLVVHAVEALAAGGVSRVAVVVADALRPDFARALTDAPIPVELVTGGARRQDSVRLGLEALASIVGDDPAVVLVHDAARPLVPAAVVRRVSEAIGSGEVAVVPVVPVVDSIRRLSDQDPDGPSSVVDRSQLRAVQTPQGFDFASLLAAHRSLAEVEDELTDDAAVAERAGHQVALVDGSRDALKVTEPVDLLLAEAILAARATESEELP